MQAVTIILFLIGLSSANAHISQLIAEYADSSSTPASTTPTPSVCTEFGVVCKTCQNVVSCLPDPNGGFVEMPYKTCPNNTGCSEGDCVDLIKAPECSPLAKIPFVCLTVGVFPDPVDCKKYHMCYPDQNNPKIIKNADVKCENDDNYYYNPKTYTCDKKLPSNGKCSAFPVPTCKQVGEQKALTGNPSIYYTCLPVADGVLYPYLQACPNGKIWSSSYEECR